MSPSLKNILDILENIAPKELAEDWDNPGLQVGSYTQEISRIQLALDPTPEALESASKSNAQLLLTHHPLIFKPIACVEIESYPGNVIFEALTRGISIVAIHTNLDVARGGINDILADLLGLQQVSVLAEINRIDGTGLGRIGNLPKTEMLGTMTRKVKQKFNTSHLGIVGNEGKRINRIAVVGGAGGQLVTLASEKGADLFITGDVGHHHALEAKMLGIAVIDAGHYYTEKRAFEVFAECFQRLVQKEYEDVVVNGFEGSSNPIQPTN